LLQTAYHKRMNCAHIQEKDTYDGVLNIDQSGALRQPADRLSGVYARAFAAIPSRMFSSKRSTRSLMATAASEGC